MCCYTSKADNEAMPTHMPSETGSDYISHAMVMKLCGTKKVRFGFTGMYAFAGSDDYYPKLPYICIALAPVVLLGIVIAIVNPLVPESWFWVVYFIQIVNVSGAGGDLYVTFRFASLPKDILVRDYGVGMHVYSTENNINDLV